VDLEKELKRKIQTWGNGKGKTHGLAHTHTHTHTHTHAHTHTHTHTHTRSHTHTHTHTHTLTHTHSQVWVGGRQIKVQILSGKDRVLKYKGKIYGTDLGWKDERAKDSFDILSPDDRKEE